MVSRWARALPSFICLNCVVSMCQPLRVQHFQISISIRSISFSFAGSFVINSHWNIYYFIYCQNSLIHRPSVLFDARIHTDNWFGYEDKIISSFIYYLIIVRHFNEGAFKFSVQYLLNVMSKLKVVRNEIIPKRFCASKMPLWWTKEMKIP